jgi:hypothetical protein
MASFGARATVAALTWKPLLVVEDVLLGASGTILLPAVPSHGLALRPGDVVDLLHGESREEAEVLGLEPDRDPARVRLRVAARPGLGPGVEVWLTQSESHVAFREAGGTGYGRATLTRAARR